MNTINTLLAGNFFGAGSTSGSFGIGADLLTAWASSRAGVGVDTSQFGRDPKAPIATVWQPGISPSAAALVQRAFDGKSFFDTKAKLYSDLGAQGDYQRLFALHSGISTLQALVGQLEDTKLGGAVRAAAEKQFARGLKELEDFFASQQFDDIRLSQGDRVDEAQSTLAVARTSEDYTTGIIHRGNVSAVMSGLDPNAAFDIVATTPGGTERRVSIDLAEMGSLPRSLSNVVTHINNKLSAAGAATRFEAVDQTPKTTNLKIGSQTIVQPYTGLKQYALKVDVRAGETVSLEPNAASRAFYVVGNVGAGAHLIKIGDVAEAAGQPVWFDRPEATSDPIGAFIATGWFGPGAPYGGAPDEAFEKRSAALVSDGLNNFEPLLRAAGDATLKFALADGRSISVSTSWRSDDLEAWRTLAGETSDKAMLNDLAERFTQLLHEQGVAAGVEVWENGTKAGLSVYTGDQVRATGLVISGRTASLSAGAEPASGLVGGLRNGVYARQFDAVTAVASSELFYGAFGVSVTTAAGAKSISIDGGEDGIDAATLAAQINAKLSEDFTPAAVEVVDVGGFHTLRVYGLHDLVAASASYDEATTIGARTAPSGANVSGGLPLSGAGEPFGDALRTYNVAGGSPLLTHNEELDIEIVVATPAGNKTVSVSISAAERLLDPDPVAGELSAALKARIDEALNAAGVYVGALSSDLTQWASAESASQRISSISINGDALTLSSSAPSFGLGGAFSAERSFTSAQGSSGVADDVAALIADQNVSITFGTVWGEQTINATLQGGDARTLESAALRLNEALSAAGYDLGVEAVALSGGGAGLRLVSGASRTIRNVESISLGATQISAGLDPIDSASHADDPIGAARVAERAARGAAVTETIPTLSTLTAPSGSGAGWFPGRAFDVQVGGVAKVGAARAVATGGDGSVYVLADLTGDSNSLAIKGARDVALLKYDSAGKLLYTRVLGASEEASGYALAVSADGEVAVAGSVTGALSGAGTEKGGTDSFVALFDAQGNEVWTARRGASADDEVRAVAFAPDGGIIVAGKTGSALGVNVALGGADGYVRGFSAAGLETFTKQFGTGGDDAATALLVRDDGAGGAEIFTAGVENNRGVVRAFTYSASAGAAAGAVRDIGFFYQGAINALAADGSSLYVGGEIGADRLTLSATARGAVAGQEGFVARIDADLVSTGLDRATYVGSAKEDSVTALAIVDGQVYAAGSTAGIIAGQGPSIKAGFLARLDDSGDIDWTRTFASTGGAMAPTGLAISSSGVSALDALGLPGGRIGATTSTKLVDNSALRAGDEFRVGKLGGRLTTITISAGETMASLLVKVNRGLGSAGRAELVREADGDRIRILPREGEAAVIESGREGRDALGGLGLSAGVIATNTKQRGETRTYGLGIVGKELKLDTPTDLIQTKAELSAAISIIRQAYEALANPNAKELTDAENALQARRDAAAGQAPAYYTQQLANYRTALARLSGGF